MTHPWQDRLARSRAGPVAATNPVAARVAPGMTTAPSADDLLRVAPGLQPLIRERATLERRMSQLAGGTVADPRYPVTPMAERRAELAQWAAPRDRRREDSRPITDPAITTGRRTLSEPLPPLRRTPGETVPAGRIPLDTIRWSSLRDSWSRRWKERSRKIPQLPLPPDPYLRDASRKLSVAVGSLEDIGEKSDRLRRQASAMRDLAAADEAGDDARRDRALKRLQARRTVENDDPDARRDSSRSRETEPLLSRDRRRANKETAYA